MSKRKISDVVRALEMMANNAKMAEHLRAEVRRIAQELREIDAPCPDCARDPSHSVICRGVS